MATLVFFATLCHGSTERLYTRYLQCTGTQCNTVSYMQRRKDSFFEEKLAILLLHTFQGKKSLQLPSLHTYSRPTPPVSLMDCLSWDFPPTKPPRLTSPCLSPPQDLHIPTAAVYQGLSLWVNPFVGGEGGSRGVGVRLPRLATYRYLRQKKALPFLLSNVLCALRGRNEAERDREKMCLFVSPPPPSHGAWSKGGGRDRFQMLILKNPPLVSSFPTYVCACVRIRIYPFSLLSHLSCHSWQRQKGSLLLLLPLLFSLFGPKTRRGGIHHRSRGYSGFGKDTFLC